MEMTGRFRLLRIIAPRGREIVARGASVLLFCVAATMTFVFPESKAGILQIGFAPAQNEPENPSKYRSPEFCAKLGGDVRTVTGGGESADVCVEIDQAGTFCFIGATEVFPCAGLFKHVEKCNQTYQRPAKNPFICDVKCGPNFDAVGAKCVASASGLLNLALPAGARNVTVIVRPDHSGPAGQFFSREEGVSLFVTPQFSGNISLAADGVFSVDNPARNLRGRFNLTITSFVPGKEGGTAAEVNVLLRPLATLEMASASLTEGANLSAVSLIAAYAKPSVEFLPQAASVRVDSALLPEGFSLAADGGDVFGPANLAPGTYDIIYAAEGGIFYAPITGILRVVGVPEVINLQFAGTALNAKGATVSGLTDTRGDSYEATYWGRRRGLHYVVAQLGDSGNDIETTDPGDPNAAAPSPFGRSFDIRKRRDPDSSTSPDTRWSLLDYLQFCETYGGASGVGGRQWRVPTVGEAAALAYSAQNSDAEFLTLHNRITDDGIPGLSPSGMKIPLPPRDGRDSAGPTSGAVAFYGGAPTVPNGGRSVPNPYQLWSAAVSGGSGFGAFFPWESRSGSETIQLPSGGTDSAAYTEYFSGAVGHAACVVEHSQGYPEQPKLAVMDFDYAGKNVKCRVNARPAENCGEAGDWETTEFLDSAFSDESVLRATLDVSGAGAARVAKVLTLWAKRFGGSDASPQTDNISGETEHAEVRTLNGGGEIALVKTRQASNYAVYAVSLASDVSRDGIYRERFSAHPRVGTAARLQVEIHATTPPTGPPIESHVIWVAPGWEGALYTITAFAGTDPNFWEPVTIANGMATAGSVVLLLTPLSAPPSKTRSLFGGRISLSAPVELLAPIPAPPFVSPESGVRVGDDAALVAIRGGAETPTVQVVALPLALNPVHINVGLADANGALATLTPPFAGWKFADADPDDAFDIGADGVVSAAEGKPVIYHQVRRITARIDSENARGISLEVNLILNGAKTLPAARGRQLNHVYPLIPRPNSNTAARIPGTQLLYAAPTFFWTDNLRFAVASGFAGPIATAKPREDNLPRGFSANLAAPCPDGGLDGSGFAAENDAMDGVWVDDGVLNVDASKSFSVRIPADSNAADKGQTRHADSRLITCPVDFPFSAELARVFGNVPLGFSGFHEYYGGHLGFGSPEFYYERPSPGSALDLVTGKIGIEMHRIGPVSPATIYAGAAENALITDGAVVMDGGARAQVWAALGTTLRYATLRSDSEDAGFSLSEEGQLFAASAKAGETYQLTAEAVAAGMAGTIFIPLDIRTVPERVFSGRNPLGRTNLMFSIPITTAAMTEAAGRAVTALKAAGFNATVHEAAESFGGRERSLEAWPSANLAAGECRRAIVRVAVWANDAETIPAEFWSIEALAGSGGECENIRRFVPAVKETEMFARVKHERAGEVAAIAPLPFQASIMTQFDAPDLSGSGISVAFEKRILEGDLASVILFDSLGAATATVDGVKSERIVMTMEIAADGALDFAEKRTVAFRMTVYEGSARDEDSAAAVWDFRLYLAMEDEYNVLFIYSGGAPEEGKVFSANRVGGPGGVSFDGPLVVCPFHSILDADYWRHPPYVSSLDSALQTFNNAGLARTIGPLILPDGTLIGRAGNPTAFQQIDFPLPGVAGVSVQATDRGADSSKTVRLNVGADVEADKFPILGRFRMTTYADVSATVPGTVVNFHYYLGWGAVEDGTEDPGDSVKVDCR